MSPADIVRWIVAAGCLATALSALATTNLGKRNALSMGFSISIGAVLCLSHLLNDEPTLVRAIDALMLAAVCLGAGALFGHAWRLHRAEQASDPTAPKARLKS